MDFKIKGHHHLKVEGEIKGHHKGDKVKAKFKSDKTHGVAAELIGKVDGKFVAKPGSSLKAKMKKSKGVRGLFTKKKHQVTEKDFKSVAKEAFRKMKKEAKDQGLPTSHMKLKIKT